MGKSKSNLKDLKKDVRPIRKEEMKKIIGGREKGSKWKRFLNICGNILPQ
ncbi:MAG: hypothetical protein KDC34_08335 [Saprospiraceae bacterium]|nr:hypothetical protein [Saprospiraceae bacterium]